MSGKVISKAPKKKASKEKIVIKIQTDIPWKYLENPDTGMWIGICDPLGVTAQGESYTDLLENIADVMELLFDELVKSNELEQFLKDKRWKSIPDVSSIRGTRLPVQVAVPMHTVQLEPHDLARAVC